MSGLKVLFCLDKCLVQSKYFKIRGQSYKDFYTLGKIYKCVLKHENNALAQTFVGLNVRTQHPNIFVIRDSKREVDSKIIILFPIVPNRLFSGRMKNNRHFGYPETKITDFKILGTRLGTTLHHCRLILETKTESGTKSRFQYLCPKVQKVLQDWPLVQEKKLFSSILRSDNFSWKVFLSLFRCAN